MQVAPAPVDVDHLAQQQRAPVAQARRVAAELVAGVGLRDRAFGRRVAGEDGEVLAQRLAGRAPARPPARVEREQPRLRRGRGLPGLVEPFELTRERVVEQRPGGDGHRVQASRDPGQAVGVGVDDGLGAVAGADLGEDVVDVALDRGGGDHEALGDLGVGQALGDQGQDLDLARGEVVGRVRGRGGGVDGGQDVVLDRGVQRRLAAGDGSHGGADLVGARVLGQVAAGAGAQRAEHARVVGVGGQRDRAGAAGAQAPDRLDAVHPRHPQVHQHDVRVVLRGQRERLLAVGRGGHQLDAVEQPEQRAEALADDALVVGEQDADHCAGSHSSTLKPSSVGPAFRRPPSSSARSRMPVSP